MDNIDIYNNSAKIFERKTPKSVISWITILIILFVLFIIISFIPFNIYKDYIGKIIDNKIPSNIQINVNKSDFPIKKDRILYIEDIKYNYKIKHIYSDKVIIELKIDDSINIKDNLLQLNILYDKTTLGRIIINKIKKGFGL